MKVEILHFLGRLTPAPIKKIIRSPVRRVVGKFAANDDLLELCLKHETDKASHGYLAAYQEHFSGRRTEVTTVLEIGVGGYGDVDKGGESLRMWAEYFPNAMIHGVDIHNKSAIDTTRIKTHEGSQIDADFLDRLMQKTGAPDIVIDDGSHVNEHIIFTFEHLFPHVRPGGFYVIEDLATSYMPEYGGDPQNLDRRDISTGYIKTLVDVIHHDVIAGRSPGSFDGMIESMSLYKELCVIKKAK
jgi:hypothetical protein